MPLNHRCSAAGLCMLNRVQSNTKHCLFGELSQACERVRLTLAAAAAARPYEFVAPRFRTSQLVRCFLPALVRVWSDFLFGD